MPTYQEQFETKMNALANSINTKAGSSGKKTIDELKTAVDGITPAKTEQTKTVALSMASGDQEVTPDSNKVLTKVTITKPDTLIAGNIKKDVVIGGVTGSYEGSGGATVTGYKNKHIETTQTRYIGYIYINNTTVFSIYKSGQSVRNIYNGNLGDKRKILYNDGTSKEITTNDTFKIQYDIPSDLVAAVGEQVGYDHIEIEYWYGPITMYNSNGRQEQLEAGWNKRLYFYKNGVLNTNPIIANYALFSSTTATSIASSYIQVPNWQLYYNGVLQTNVVGVAIYATSSTTYLDCVQSSAGSDWDWNTAHSGSATWGSYNKVITSSQVVSQLYSTGGKAPSYETDTDANATICASIIAQSSTYSNFMGPNNYPLISTTTTLFNE